MAEAACQKSNNYLTERVNEPLDTLQIKVNSRNGVQKIVSALNIGFMDTRHYVHFKLPPISENDAKNGSLNAEEEEWLECTSFLEDDLHWLLKLPYHRFWSQVLFDEDLHVCLESYLSQALREYDIKNFFLKDEISSVLKKIHRLVFLVYLRMSTYKESKEHYMRPEAFAGIIYDNFLFDVPKIMDLCVLYGFKNSPLVTKMVQNIFTTQPKYLDDLVEISRAVLTTFNSAEDRLFENTVENGDLYKAESTQSEIKDLPLPAFFDVISYVTDISATIYALLEIYPPACKIFCQNGASRRIGSFYDIFPAVEKELKKLKKFHKSDRFVEGIEKNVVLSKTFLIKTFRNILSFCYIQPILNSICSESKEENSSGSAYAAEFLEVFVHLASEKMFLCDYNILYPFETDLELFNQVHVKLDPEHLHYVFCSIHDSSEICENASPSKNDNAQQNMQVKNASNIIPNDVKNLHSVAAILKSENAISKNEYSDSSLECSSKPYSKDLKIESLIHSVCGVVPSLGDGFVLKCLEYYSYDAEKVIDAHFNNSLPSALNVLDRNLKREDMNTMDNTAKNSVLSERRSIFDNDEFDMFSGKDINMENVHIGKMNKTPTDYQVLEKGEETDFLKQIILTYGSEETDYSEEANTYDDEYDDTYDSAMVGLKEPALEGEPDREEPTEEKNNKQQPEISTFENRKRDNSLDFCINPEILREKAEQRRLSKMGKNRSFRDDTPSSSSQGNSRQHKDRHKSQVANHNRRKQSDYKKSRGMFPSH